MQFVVGLLVLYLGLTHSWDFAVTHGDLLEFYTNDTKTDTVRLDSHDLGALAYDEVHDIMMYVDKQRNNDAICGYRMYSKVHQCFTKRNGRNIHSLAIDPAKETLFFSDTNERSIRRISLKLDSDFEDHNVITMFLGIPTDIAVDICSGFVYFIRTGVETPLIEKIRVDGTGGEVVIRRHAGVPTAT
ncbi:hypothetical protein PYW07_010807 [Mythimna separata]|uniref:Uncharacterized protein n=1 Tax=Mythimna separata TaxID=271217 RepID=A0AAD7Y7S8_MYTSE|nr:hypothetical protein PYW07_010807 [Mythimna separata]